MLYTSRNDVWHVLKKDVKLEMEHSALIVPEVESWNCLYHL